VDGTQKQRGIRAARADPCAAYVNLIGAMTTLEGLRIKTEPDAGRHREDR